MAPRTVKDGIVPINVHPVLKASKFATRLQWLEENVFKEGDATDEAQKAFAQELKKRYMNLQLKYITTTGVTNKSAIPLVMFYEDDSSVNVNMMPGGRLIFDEREDFIEHIRYLYEDVPSRPKTSAEADAQVQKYQGADTPDYYVIPTGKLWNFLLDNDYMASTAATDIQMRINTLVNDATADQAEIDALKIRLAGTFRGGKDDVLEYYKLANAYMKLVRADEQAKVDVGDEAGRATFIGYKVSRKNKEIENARRAFYKFIQNKNLSPPVPVIGAVPVRNAAPSVELNVDVKYKAFYTAFESLVEFSASGAINNSLPGNLISVILKIAVFDWQNPVSYMEGDLRLHMLRYRYGLVNTLKKLTLEGAEMAPGVVMGNQEAPVNLSPDQIQIVRSFIKENEHLFPENEDITPDEKATRLQAFTLSLKAYVLSRDRAFHEKLLFVFKMIGRDLSIDIGVRTFMQALLAGTAISFEIYQLLYMFPFVAAWLGVEYIKDFTKWASDMMESPPVAWSLKNLPDALKAYYGGGVYGYGVGVGAVATTGFAIWEYAKGDLFKLAYEFGFDQLRKLFTEITSMLTKETLTKPDFVCALAVRISTAVVTMGYFITWTGQATGLAVRTIQSVVLLIAAGALSLSPQYLLMGDQMWMYQQFAKAISMVQMAPLFKKGVDKLRTWRGTKRLREESSLSVDSSYPFSAIPLKQINISSKELALSTTTTVLFQGLLLATGIYLQGETLDQLWYTGWDMVNVAKNSWEQAMVPVNLTENATLATLPATRATTIMDEKWVKARERDFPNMMYTLTTDNGASLRYLANAYGGPLANFFANTTTYKVESPSLNFTFTSKPCIGGMLYKSLRGIFEQIGENVELKDIVTIKELEISDIGNMILLPPSTDPVEQVEIERKNQWIKAFYYAAAVFGAANNTAAWLRSTQKNWTIHDQRAVIRVATFNFREYAKILKGEVISSPGALKDHILKCVSGLGAGDDNVVKNPEILRKLLGIDAGETPEAKRLQDELFIAMMSDKESVERLLDIWHPTSARNYTLDKTTWDARKKLYSQVLEFTEGQPAIIKDEIINKLVDYVAAIFYNPIVYVSNSNQAAVSDNNDSERVVKQAENLRKSLLNPDSKLSIADRKDMFMHIGTERLNEEGIGWERINRLPPENYTGREQVLRRVCTMHIYNHIMMEVVASESDGDKKEKQSVKTLLGLLRQILETSRMEEKVDSVKDNGYLQFSPVGISGLTKQITFSFILSAAYALCIRWVTMWKFETKEPGVLDKIDKILKAAYFKEQFADQNHYLVGLIVNFMPDWAHYWAALAVVLVPLFGPTIMQAIKMMREASPPAKAIRFAKPIQVGGR